MYINDFLLSLNTIVTFDILKKLLAKVYNIKTIIKQQIIKDKIAQIMKINQLTFMQDIIIEKSLINCKANIIFIRVRLAITLIKADNYKEINL